MKKFLVVLLVVILFGGSIYTLGWSKVLPVKKIQIYGTAHTDVVEQILQSGTARIYVGQPIARVNIHALRSKLNLVPWIGNSLVRRDWLNGIIEVDVTERIPVAQFSPRSGQLMFFDDTGVEFIPIGITPKLPVINFTTSDIEARRSVAILVQQLPADLLAAMRGMTVSSPRSLLMSCTFNTHNFSIEWGAATEMASKVKVLRALLRLPENTSATLFNLATVASPVVK
ncbi:MAG: FtsQ-type POTRA domain-containing protein [Actinomycetes bacterium]